VFLRKSFEKKHDTPGRQAKPEISNPARLS